MAEDYCENREKNSWDGGMGWLHTDCMHQQLFTLYRDKLNQI